MPFCTHCGTEIQSTDSFCTQCGKPLGRSLPTGNGVSNELAHFVCNLFLILGPVFFLNIEPFKWQKETQFHCWQSIFFGAAWLASNMVLGIMSMFLGVFSFLSIPVSILFFVVWILMMVKSLQGKVFRVPILAEMADKQVK